MLAATAACPDSDASEHRADRRLNFTSPVMGELASAAYTVYLIHPWVVVPIVRSSSEFARVVAQSLCLFGLWCWLC